MESGASPNPRNSAEELTGYPARRDKRVAAGTLVPGKVTNYSGTLKISDNESQLLQFFPLTNLPAMEKRAEMIVRRILDKTIKA